VTASTTPDTARANASWSDVFSPNGKAVEQYFALITSSATVPVCTVAGVENGSPVVTRPSGSKVIPAGTTTTTFSGLDANETYTVWVFAYNGQGCTGAQSAPIIPRLSPGVITAVDAPLVANGGSEFYDFRLDAFTITSGSTDADQFVVEIGGSSSGMQELGSFLTIPLAQYGSPLDVRVSACRAYPEVTLCGPPSEVFALGTPVRNSTPGGLVHDADALDGTWSWTSTPMGSGYTAVEYRCQPGNNDDGWLPMPATGSCETGGLLGLFAEDLRVRITANGGETYIRSYAAFEYPPPPPPPPTPTPTPTPTPAPTP
jgi:hypothetical protein